MSLWNAASTLEEELRFKQAHSWRRQGPHLTCRDCPVSKVKDVGQNLRSIIWRFALDLDNAGLEAYIVNTFMRATARYTVAERSLHHQINKNCDALLDSNSFDVLV